jgi:hypothetical protein
MAKGLGQDWFLIVQLPVTDARGSSTAVAAYSEF